MANTPQRSIRVSDDIWQKALRRAEQEGITLTALLVKVLDEYGERN